MEFKSSSASCWINTGVTFHYIDVLAIDGMPTMCQSLSKSFGDSSGQTDLTPFSWAAYIQAEDKKVFINEENAQTLEENSRKM